MRRAAAAAIIAAGIAIGAGSAAQAAETEEVAMSEQVQAQGQVIGHDQIVGFAEVAPTTLDQRLAERFQPFLEVRTGCVPFPVVDAAGNTGGGLAPSGSSSGDCDSSTGQVYTRAGWNGDDYAIMYAWYFPKDSPSSGFGHRHDWEHVLVWVDDPYAADPQIEKISFFRHGEYSHVDATAANTEGTHPTIAYFHTWPLNHTIWETENVGGTQPLIGWDDLTDAARDALTTVDLGDANVSIHDAGFASHLERGHFR
ncbi:NPP1 family protein [Microbacterium karelineae]|uniref:NPP1 family protein n=1 Tax=Microbacterium karelineae TaxID=2654283 RepID=UPI0018D3779C|nr:NPP1 family protein [Microbacterium karelineae]